MLIPPLALLLALHSAPADSIPLYPDLGDHGYRITTTDPAVQRYFDQGLRLYYAFNHAEAIRAFREAQRLEPGCAMCYWGEALSWGPNINAPMDSAGGVAAEAAATRAMALRSGASDRERGMIEAAAARYSSDPATSRAQLDSAYASAMTALARRNPGDHEIAVLAA